MKSFAVCAVLLAVGIVTLGFWRGWFEMGGKKEDGKVHVDVDLNVNKLKVDKDAFKKTTWRKVQGLEGQAGRPENQGQGPARRGQGQS